MSSMELGDSPTWARVDKDVGLGRTSGRFFGTSHFVQACTELPSEHEKGKKYASGRSIQDITQFRALVHEIAIGFS